MDQAEREKRDEEQRAQRRAQSKAKNQTHKLVIDELAPKETGHDAKVAAQITRKEDRKSKEDSPDVVNTFEQLNS